jgi:methylamine dehydrogenase accessory protein MauD
LQTILLISSLFLWVVVLLNLLLTLALIRRLNASAPRSHTLLAGLKVGEQAPPFTVQTLDGQTKTLAAYTGRSTVFIFVAPECQPCQELLPALEKIRSQASSHGAELVLICDGNEEQTQTLVKQMQIRLPILLAPRKDHSFFKDYQVLGTPAYYVLNEQGKIEAAGHPNQYDPAWKRLLDSWTS